MTVDQIEDAVTQLPPNALEQFAQWFEEYISDQDAMGDRNGEQTTINYSVALGNSTRNTQVR
jgi:hypothetical protein